MTRDEHGAAEPGDDLTGLAAAYALGALDEVERAEFERALAASPELRAEVAAFRESAAALGSEVAPVDPPPSLRASILDRLDGVPQVDAPSAPSASPAAVEADVPASAPALPGPLPVTSGPAERTARRRWFQRPAAILVAAAAVLLLVVGGVVAANWLGPNGWGAQRQLVAIQEAPDAVVVTAPVDGGGAVTVVSSASLARSAAMVEGLPRLDDGRVYELWYLDEAGAAAAGLIGSGGDHWRVLDGDFAVGRSVGITVEPSGGSPQPTTDPIIVVPA